MNTKRTSDFSKGLNLSRTKVLVLALMGIMLLGVLIGTLTFCNMKSGDFSNLSFITQGFIKNRGEQTFIKTLLTSFYTSGLLALICFLLGFSAIAQPIEILVPLFRGIGLGTSIAYIYSCYGFKGFFIALIMIMPHAVISSIAIIIAARESMRLSNLFTNKAMSSKNEGDLRSSIKLYLLKFVILFGIIAISALIDSILTFSFAGILFK